MSFILSMTVSACLAMGWWVQPPPYAAEIQWAACRAKVNPLLVSKIIYVESRFHPHALNKETSVNDWSVGLMQIRVATSREMGYHKSPLGLMGPETNLKYGIKFLKQMIVRYGRGAISAYNAGHPCRCNRRYVWNVMKAPIY